MSTGHRWPLLGLTLVALAVAGEQCAGPSLSVRTSSLVQKAASLEHSHLREDAEEDSEADSESFESSSGSASASPDAEVAGLTNEGVPCFVRCGRTPGDCSFCGTGQCCRRTDYVMGARGCELARDVIGSRCGSFKSSGAQVGLRNEGAACWGHCNSTAGGCAFCGAGQCCRRVDAERCVPGCELASTVASGARCGNFTSSAGCVPSSRPGPAPVSTGAPSSQPSPAPAPPAGLLHGGQSCRGPCGLTGAAAGGPCPGYCGTGQCCGRIDWYRGVPGCELAENNTQAVCGDFNSPHPEPAEFRLPPPLGTVQTPPRLPPSAGADVAGWIRDIAATVQDDVAPAHSGDGGKPWSPYEMAQVRDLILREIRRSTAGRDETSGAKMLRLVFHDCLKYPDGSGGCDGCVNWHSMGTEFGGENRRVEDRELEDHQRRPNSNGLQPVIEFLEYIYNFDFGMVAGACWQTPATVSGDWIYPTKTHPIQVNSTEECQQRCQNTTGCVYFTVPQLPFVPARGGPCRLFGASARWTALSSGRMIAGYGDCPEGTPSWSLKGRGKSRADLWAFAALVAVEEGIQRHNSACRGDRGRPVQCIQFEGEPGCEVQPSRPFVFKTGRKDCSTSLVPSYKSEVAEAHPDEHFNGTMTVRFMEDHFGFSAKETVTIMGAHTLGRFHQRKSGHKYVWTTDWQAFNNQYYRNIAGKEDWFFDDLNCTKVGDAWGNKGSAVWIAKMNQVYRTGAPIQWIQKKVVCPNCAAKSYNRGGRHPERLALDRDCCLNGVPEGAQCRPDGSGAPGTKARVRDGDFSWGCEYSHFIFGKDETALSSDMGLMYKFDVDRRGFPSGCPGLGTFYPSSMRFSDWTCGIDGRPWLDNPDRVQNNWTARACPADCPRQDYKYHDDDLTLAEHVERFADDQAAWIEEFLPTMEKMLANGYTDAALLVSWPLTGPSSLLSGAALRKRTVHVMRADDA